MNIRKFFKSLIIILLIGFAGIGGFVVANWLITGEPPSIIGNIVPDKVEDKTVLILGTDGSRTNSDVMMLACYDADSNSVDLISILRDTRVKIGSRYQKINAAYAIGKEELSTEVVSELMNMPIDNYVSFSFDGFRDIIDILGGVDFYVPYDMKYTDPYQDLYINLKEGQQHLDGNKAEQLVRFRGYIQGDVKRTEVQRDFLKALFEQKLNSDLIGKIPQLLPKLLECVNTDLSLTELLGYAGQVKNLEADSLRTYQLPGEAKNINGVSFFIADPAGIEELKQTMENNRNPEPTPGEDGENAGPSPASGQE